MAGFDPKRVTTLDWVVIGAGGLAFIDSFLPWYTASIEGQSLGSASGWHSYSWLAILLLVAAGALVLTANAGQQINLPAPIHLITLGLSGLATLLILLRWLTWMGDKGTSLFSLHQGAGFGMILGLILGIAASVASFLAFRASGGNFNQVRRSPGAPPPPPSY
jgi:hypothetical protein